MNIGFLTRSISRDAGGIFEVEVALAKELTALGCVVSAFGATDKNAESDAPKWAPVVPQFFPHYGNNSFRYAPSLRKAFLAGNFDLCHVHSLWSYTSLVGSEWTTKNQKPLLVSPNGMLDAWALKNSFWRKKLIALLIENKMLARAACIQANTEKDIIDYRNLGLTNPIATIPNGVYAPDSLRIANAQTRFGNGMKKQAVYLGRIHPKKGLANFLHAWGRNKEKMRGADWQFVLAGKDEAGHLAELKKLCSDYQLEIGTADQRANADVIIMGPTYGEEKFNLHTSSHLFVLPSFSEGLPMAVLEAWAHGTPAMMSPQCNLNSGFESGAAFSVDPTIESISRGMLMILELSDGELAKAGRAGRKLVEEQFVWSSVTKQMYELYSWLVGGGSRPDFVVQ